MEEAIGLEKSIFTVTISGRSLDHGWQVTWVVELYLWSVLSHSNGLLPLRAHMLNFFFFFNFGWGELWSRRRDGSCRRFPQIFVPAFTIFQGLREILESHSWHKNSTQIALKRLCGSGKLTRGDHDSSQLSLGVSWGWARRSAAGRLPSDSNCIHPVGLIFWKSWLMQIFPKGYWRWNCGTENMMSRACLVSWQY